MTGGEGSLFGGGVDVGEISADGVLGKGSVLCNSVKDLFLVRGEVNVGGTVREESLHEVRQLVEGGLVEFL